MSRQKFKSERSVKSEKKPENKRSNLAKIYAHGVFAELNKIKNKSRRRNYSGCSFSSNRSHLALKKKSNSQPLLIQARKKKAISSRSRSNSVKQVKQ